MIPVLPSLYSTLFSNSTLYNGELHFYTQSTIFKQRLSQFSSLCWKMRHDKIFATDLILILYSKLSLFEHFDILKQKRHKNLFSKAGRFSPWETYWLANWGSQTISRNFGKFALNNSELILVFWERFVFKVSHQRALLRFLN